MGRACISHAGPMLSFVSLPPSSLLAVSAVLLHGMRCPLRIHQLLNHGYAPYPIVADRRVSDVSPATSGRCFGGTCLGIGACRDVGLAIVSRASYEEAFLTVPPS